MSAGRHTHTCEHPLGKPLKARLLKEKYVSHTAPVVVRFSIKNGGGGETPVVLLRIYTNFVGKL